MRDNKDLRKSLTIELEELQEKFTRLHDFINDSEKFLKIPEAQQDLLLKQAQYMGGYISTLKKRINLL